MNSKVKTPSMLLCLGFILSVSQVGWSQSTCSYESDCDIGFQCIGATGNCMLPAFWKGPRYVECSSTSECQQHVLLISQCIIKRYGTCLPEDELCRDQDKWTKECPDGLLCDASKVCVNMTGVADFQIGERDPTEELIFALSPSLVNFLTPVEGVEAQDSLQFGRADKQCLKLSDCASGELCCPNGKCSNECDAANDVQSSTECSSFNPNGNCQIGLECQAGRCKRIQCSSRKPCPDQLACVDNFCSRDRHIIELPKFCSAINPFGYCEPGYECRSGICTSANACNANNWNGVCPKGEVCKNGICVDKFHQCSPRNFQGFCPYGEECREGVCQKENLCSQNNPKGDCPGDNQMCLNGTCVETCSRTNMLGFCPDGEACHIQGYCVQDCSLLQPRGFCPFGQTCLDGKCKPRTRCLLCMRGQVCQNGRCVNTCEKETDCSSDQVCDRGICVPDTQKCSIDGDECPEGHFCDQGYCEEEVVEPRIKGTCSSGSFSCPANQLCRFGKCVSRSKRPNKIYLPGGVTIAFGRNRKRLFRYY